MTGTGPASPKATAPWQKVPTGDSGSSRKPLWTPSPERAAASCLERFRAWLAEEHGAEAHDYESLHRWSVKHSDRFWAAAWDFFEVKGERGKRLRAAPESAAGAYLYQTRFLPDARLNVAENLLGRPSEEIAVIFASEDGEAVQLTRAELHDMTGRCQRLLIEAGVGPGDRVAAWMPNRPETYAIMLAAAGLGAVFSSASPDFGASGVLERFGQISPSVLFACSDYPYNGRRHDCRRRLEEIAAGLKSLKRTVLVEPGWLDGYGSGAGPAGATLPAGNNPIGSAASRTRPAASKGATRPAGSNPSGPNTGRRAQESNPAGATCPADSGPDGSAASRTRAAAASRGATHTADSDPSGAPTPVVFRSLPFDHPWYVLYSSGTTGPPKCIVHRAGGLLVKHLVEHRLHCDVRPGDRVFYFTTTGWMMWNWLASALACDAAVVLYDGAPAWPGAERLFDLIDETGLTLFGTSAKFIDACRNADIRPAATHSLASLRTIASTGSPLVAEAFDWVHDNVKADVHLASISGGTDLCGCLVAGDPSSPVYRGEIQRPALGLDMDVSDDAGASQPAGVEGELVCRNAFPSMPLRFAEDPGDAKYRAAYFERIDGVWHHGDFAMRTPSGGFVISGRSDTTLNPSGVRIGTTELYRRVDSLPEVEESIAVGQPRGSDTRIVLFMRMAAGCELTDELRDTVRRRIRAELSPRHVPAVILSVPDIPRTRSGKMTEASVRDVVCGRPVRNTSALANPEALEHFRDRPELAR